MLATPRTDRTRHRGSDRSPHARVGHLLHEHEEGKYERQAGEGAGPEVPEEIRIDARGDGDQHHVHHDVRRRESEQRRDDGPLEKEPRPRCAGLVNNGPRRGKQATWALLEDATCGVSRRTLDVWGLGDLLEARRSQHANTAVT